MIVLFHCFYPSPLGYSDNVLPVKRQVKIFMTDSVWYLSTYLSGTNERGVL